MGFTRALFVHLGLLLALSYIARETGKQIASHLKSDCLVQLAPGGHLGRFIIWTKSAFSKLDDLYGESSHPKIHHHLRGCPPTRGGRPDKDLSKHDIFISFSFSGLKIDLNHDNTHCTHLAYANKHSSFYL